MSITKTEALVLKSIKFGDTSRIATLYTQNYGKIKVIAKGIRKPKNRLAGALQTFSHIQIVFYKKQTTEIYLLSQSEILHSNQSLTRDLNRYVFASAAMELLDRLISGEEAHPEIFELALETLNFMESCSQKSLEKSFWAFALRLADLLGYKPKLNRCVVCGNPIPEGPVLFSPDKGGIVCKKCARANLAYLRLSQQSITCALKLQSIKTEELDTYNIPKECLKEISNLVLNLLDFHAGKGKDLKSLEFLNLKNGVESK
jgi:DNA repair protein RecO (recombination protein O)